MAQDTQTATAFAPATVANVAVGFDLLGFALDAAGDTVRVEATDRPGVAIVAIEGIVRDLPLEAERNTAGVALLALLAEHPRPGGFRVHVNKGIPLGSGMGGSAASAVGAVVAAAALMPEPPALEVLLRYALAGEAVASGAPHADNAAPCLYGGLTAVVGHDPPDVLALPVPPGLINVLVHPHHLIETRRAREALPAAIPLARHVEQTMHLCGFLAGAYTGDLSRVGRSMVDLVAEPARGPLIPGYARARDAARAAGALGFGIAGSGPSVFAWADDPATAGAIERGIRAAFAAAGLDSDGFIGPIAARGAHVVDA